MKRQVGMLCVAVTTLLSGPTPGSAAVNASITAGSWHNASVWSAGHVPLAGEDVQVGHDLLLSSDTDWLGSFAIAGVALTFSNWTTRLLVNGDAVVEAGAMLTTPSVAAKSVETNRVHVVCSNFTLRASGSLDVDMKGYGGGWDSSGRGPGGGSPAAAGHGGRGGDHFVSSSAFRGGSPYGDATAPLGPGSGGGSSDGRANFKGGNGGGSVRIDAGGHVVINGEISADGGPGTTYSTAGSGGAVWISCRTVGETGGVIRAVGRDASRGGGGGGRIAVSYDAAAQAAMPMPDIAFSARGGRTTGSAPQRDGDIGSLYFTDQALIGARVSHSGQLTIGAGIATLAFHSLTVSNGWIRFPDGQYEIVVTNELIVSGAQGRLDIGGSTYYRQTGIWRLSSASNGTPVLDVGSDFVLRDGGSAALVVGTNAGLTNVVRVGGEISVGSSCWIHVHSHPTVGSSPQITCRDLTVSQDGGISADSTGFAGGRNSRGLGPGGVRYGGGGYGGIGGAYNATQLARGAVYGETNTPTQCGSGGGANDNNARFQHGAGHGGGLIWIGVGGRVTLDGVLSADGGNAGYIYSSGASGGGIYIECRRFAGDGGTLRADGGASVNYGGGGGGRIAVWYGAPVTEELNPYLLEFSDTPPAEFTGGTVSAAGGIAGYQSGEDGSIVFVRVLPTPGTVLKLR